MTHVNTITGEVVETEEETQLVVPSNGHVIDDAPVNETDDKAIVIKQFADVVQSVMSEAQFVILSGRTPRNVIRKRPGKAGRTFSYIPHGYVTSALNKAFGFHWSFETLPNGKGDRFQIVEGIETTNDKGKTIRTPMSVLVTGRLTVYVHNPNDTSKVIAVISKDSTGEKEFVPGMTWGAMVKSAESDAFKRCASRLGIGNDLYYEEPDVLESDAQESDESKALTERVKAMRREGIAPPVIARELNVSVPDVISRLSR